MRQVILMLMGSTGNVTKETAEYLDRAATNEGSPLGPVTYQKGPYGWFVYARENEYGVDDVPKDLLAVLKKARENECEWIMLDRDEEPIEGLPVYEW